ncbi:MULTISPECIES: type VI immunity family protein [Acinetobacter]|uniref:type VI immunity family protein n=1 Tax=Acinetobacter TaxID=469 RepID=UPI002091A0D7|nr:MULTISPECIES: hypothetical protein [Acinetobacter]MDD0801482.1 hypothetical protein [Acinetobacter sp. Gutcm_16]
MSKQEPRKLEIEENDMSTVTPYLTEEEQVEWIEEIKATDKLWVTGDEGEDAYGIGPYVSFYVYHSVEEAPQLITKFIELFNEFNQMKNEEWTHFIHPIKDVFIKAEKAEALLADLDAICQRQYQKTDSVYFTATVSDDTEISSAVWSYSMTIAERPYMRYSHLKMNFRYAWYIASQANKEKWHRFVERCIDKLKPRHAYSGFEIAQAASMHLGSYEINSLEKIVAQAFYGVDIDHPDFNGTHDHARIDGYIDYQRLGSGIRTPVWSFLLDPYWITKLEKTVEEIRTYFSRFSDIKIKEIEYPENQTGLWIRLGELSMYPVEDGVPVLPVYANALIKPIRCDELKLVGYAQWDDDPNEHLSYEEGIAWMCRFDEDSSWPEGKRVSKVSNLSLEEEKLKVKGGEPCPQTGYWQTPARPDLRQYFEQGDILPTFSELDWGEVYWYWGGRE